jgi:NAD-dependent DNA ligase
VFDSLDARHEVRRALGYDARNELPYITDGLVIKVNDRAQYEKLGLWARTRALQSRISMQPSRQRLS